MLVATLATSVHWSRNADYKVVFANMSDRDAAAVSAALTQLNIPYRLADSGGAILVPSQHVHDARLKLASQGLPRGGTIGFELMEGQKFGLTQFHERLNYQRGLEGELARSIQSLSAVQGARVHLALPAQNGFLREQLKPSASVLVSLHPGRLLDRAQVAGIVHLVASSVPDMSPRQVSVIGSDGELLTGDSDSANSLDAAQLSQTRRLEASYAQRVVDLVEPIVGRGNVRAQISAMVDFSQTEATAEEFKPNQGKEPSAVRSLQVSESNSRETNPPAQGVPGALSNQPPAPASAPINGPAQNTSAAAQNSANATVNSRRDALTNYEVDRTVKVTRSATGTIKRLSAAVIVNHRRVVDESGKATQVELSEKEIEGIKTLVREAIGFEKDRGDSLNVVNAPFVYDEIKLQDLPIWRQPDNIAMAKEASKHAAVVLLGILTVFFVIRPALKLMPAMLGPAANAKNNGNADPDAQAGAQDAARGESGRRLIDESIGDAVPLPPPTVPDVQRLAKENPTAVAEVVRSWTNKNG